MILVNGVECSTLAVMDRAVQYGDGLFETVALREGKLELWEAHLQRLKRGAQRLAIPLPDVDLLNRELQQLISAFDQQQGVVKITLSRGQGGRGYAAAADLEPTRILSLTPWPYSVSRQNQARQQGVRLHICNTRLGDNPTLAGIKHLNRLEQVLARNEWSDPEIAEGVMMNLNGEMIEGTMSNLFFVRDGEVLTPDLSRCGVEGVMRQHLLQRFEHHAVTVTQRSVPLQELVVIDEAFCCNSLIGIWPIRQIGGVTLPAPGTVTHDCIHWLNGGS